MPKRSRLSRFFLRGLVTLLPIILTFVVFGLLYQMVTTYVTTPINRAIYWSLEGNGLGWRALRTLGIEPYSAVYLDTSVLPVHLEDLARSSAGGYSDPDFGDALDEFRDREESFFRDFEALCIKPTALRRDVAARVHPVFGVLLSLLLVIWLGWIVGGFLGRRVVNRLDAAFQAIPLVRTVYPYSKQLVEFFFAESKLDFDTVVAIPYPSPHLWSIAFVTNRAPVSVQRRVGTEMISCFVPSSPMPMTGYTIFVEATDIVPLRLTVDEALRITMSGGVLMPPGEKAEDGDLSELLAAHAHRPPPSEEPNE
ncbi:MAG: DUF502 domain-containing protein [Planctomycetota bacterium]